MFQRCQKPTADIERREGYSYFTVSQLNLLGGV